MGPSERGFLEGSGGGRLGGSGSCEVGPGRVALPPSTGEQLCWKPAEPVQQRKEPAEMEAGRGRPTTGAKAEMGCEALTGCTRRRDTTYGRGPRCVPDTRLPV